MSANDGWWALTQEQQDAVNAERAEAGELRIPTHKQRPVVLHSDPIRFAYSKQTGLGPIGECLCCGHIMPLAIWKDAPLSDVTHGVCVHCRDAAMPLRGACSKERGCLCAALSDPEARDE